MRILISFLFFILAFTLYSQTLWVCKGYYNYPIKNDTIHKDSSIIQIRNSICETNKKLDSLILIIKNKTDEKN